MKSYSICTILAIFVSFQTLITTTSAVRRSVASLGIPVSSDPSTRGSVDEALASAAAKTPLPSAAPQPQSIPDDLQVEIDSANQTKPKNVKKSTTAIEPRTTSVRKWSEAANQLIKRKEVTCFLACMNKVQLAIVDLMNPKVKKSKVSKAAISHFADEFTNIFTDDVGSQTVSLITAHVHQTVQDKGTQQMVVKVSETLHKSFYKGKGWKAIDLVLQKIKKFTTYQHKLEKILHIVTNGFKRIKANPIAWENMSTMIKWAKEEVATVAKQKEIEEQKKQEKESTVKSSGKTNRRKSSPN